MNRSASAIPALTGLHVPEVRDGRPPGSARAVAAPDARRPRLVAHRNKAACTAAQAPQRTSGRGLARLECRAALVQGAATPPHLH